MHGLSLFIGILDNDICGCQHKCPLCGSKEVTRFLAVVNEYYCIICNIYALVKIKEWSPKVYNEYNGVPENKEKGSGNVITLLRKAPSTFWSVGSVQFFCWFAFLFLWTYATNTIYPTIEPALHRKL